MSGLIKRVVGLYFMFPNSECNRAQRARGQVIFPVVLAVTVLLGIIGVTLAGAGYAQSLLAGQRTFAEQARQAGQAGVNDALIRIARDKNWGTDTDANNLEPATCGAPPSTCSYTLTVSGVGASAIVASVAVDRTTVSGRSQRTIVSVSTVRNVQRKLQVVLEVSSSGEVQVLSRQELTS